MRRLKEWWWALIATITIYGYLPIHFTLMEAALVLIMMWLMILFGIYFVEEMREKYEINK